MFFFCWGTVLHSSLAFFQVKLLLEMLVRKCGIDAVREVMPEEHMKLLTNIRKVYSFHLKCGTYVSEFI